MTETPEQFATRHHAGQVRRYTGEPYVTHPLWVQQLVMSVPHSPAMLAAAVLHDVVEDTQATLDDVFAFFGPEVSDLVSELTTPPTDKNLTRTQRKAEALAYLAKASASAQTIKLADLIHNVPSIVEHDPDFAKVYVKEKRDLLEVLTKGDLMLYQHALGIIQWAEAKLGTVETL